MHPPDLFTVMFIPLTRGKFACIDQADYPLIAGYRWFAVQTQPGYWYAAGQIPKRRGNLFWMHRIIAGAQPGEVVDHRNHNGLDNRGRELRRCAHHQNITNNLCMRARSGLRGVRQPKGRKGWVAYLTASGRSIYLGTFATAERAARARDDAARERHGEFARLNFPNPSEQPVPRTAVAS